MPQVPELSAAEPVFVAGRARSRVRVESSRYRFLETGGVVLGYRTSQGEVMIMDVSGPGPKAKHGLRSFEPDRSYCQRYLNAAFEGSGGLITYLGEWHTHPHGKVEPSPLDRATMATISSDQDYCAPRAVLWLHRPSDILYGLRWSDANGIFIVHGKTSTATEPEWLDAEKPPI